MVSRNTLFERLKSGCSVAEREFWQQQWLVLHPICLHLLGSEAEATEVVVEVLTEFIMKYVHIIENPLSMNSYVRLMATRKCLKIKRNWQRQVSLDFDMFEGENSFNPEEQAIIVHLVPRLSECMTHLTPKAQTALQLRYRSEMTKTAISDLLGVSKQYLGRLLKRSLELLKRCLERDEEEGAGLGIRETMP